MASALLSSFKSSTATFSSRSLARAAPRHIPAVSRLPRRYYSEDKSANSATEQEKKEETKVDDKYAEVTEKLKAKEAEVVDLTGRLRYLQADFVNLQRNAAREKEQTRDYAISKFASNLLETVDVLAIALKSVPEAALSKEKSDSSEPLSKSHGEYLQDLHTGVEMTHRLLLQTLFKYHVKPFDPTGEKFDPNFHEALYQAPIPGKEPGTVVDCQKIGYTIKDRVLRAAQVGVAQETS
ncbi:GrpE-domain-containing protein [Macrolepiota fuliginosa MF-IS2]|uniref:GrpE protein homolog n=1 Tax=Macrolepiota fuliginosa MF-IS2 TaxID=1400762 RepID=A0A9P5XRL3_9AGAR|nr:GrpE-domain-containing protein [Macrolepiota fuliginosa MF-IS2]